MKNLVTVFRREFGAYFESAIASIFLIVFALFTNGIFMTQFFQAGKADMRAFFGTLPFALNIFIPAIAMRLWTEDKKGNTFELLMTFPMRPHELVLGKYLASLLFYLVALGTTLTVPVMLFMVGSPDPGPILGGYLGAFLIGALFLAVGIFISGLCKDQITAFILTVITVFGLYLVGTDYFAAFLDGWVGGLGTAMKDLVGAASRLVDFGKGVIDLKDVFYFLSGVAIFLFLNGLSLEGRMRPRAKLVFAGAVAVCVVGFAVINWLAHDLSLGRFDVTEGRAYTVSDVSAKILRNLKVPVQIKLYVSPPDVMPTPLKTLEREITDKLEELRVASDNKLQYKVLHPEIQEGDEGQAARKELQAKGIVPFQIESIQRDEVGVKLIYSSLLIEYKEKPSEILPRLIPQGLRDLEYQLLSRIYKMTLDEKPKIAVFAPVKEEALSPEVAASLEAKEEKTYRDDYKTVTLLMRNNGYDVSRIRLDAAVADGTRLLVMLNPGKMTAEQRERVEKYLVSGGTVFLAAQGFEYSYQREQGDLEAIPEKLTLDVNQLLEKWGLKINPDVLMDESSQVISLTTGQTIGPFAVQMPVRLPNQIVVEESSIDRDEPITSRLPSIAYLWGSALDVSQPTIQELGLRSKILFTSSPRSWKTPNDGSVRLTEKNSQPPARDQMRRYPLAALLEGRFGKGADAKPGRLLVIGCSKTFSEDLIQNAPNLNLFANIIDGLAMGDDLVRIRSKMQIVRDIRKLSNADKLKYKFFTIALVPGLLFAWALTRLFLRRKEKEIYLAALRGRTE